MVDEFILYDDMQFTKNDWRNRNKIKTQNGAEWISIPVGGKINRRIRDVRIKNYHWQKKHWKTITQYYKKAKYFENIAEFIEPLYTQYEHNNLSELNRIFILKICDYLGVQTKINNSWDYQMINGKNERLAELCVQAGGTEYISGPAAKQYLDEEVFLRKGIQVTWHDYSGYPEYPQLWGPFVHEVTVLDLLFNTGTDASWYIWGWRDEHAKCTY